MSSHLAKYRLNKGNLKQVKIRETLVAISQPEDLHLHVDLSSRPTVH